MQEEILRIDSWKPTLTWRGEALAYRISMREYYLYAPLFYEIFKRFEYSQHSIRLADTATFEVLIYCSREQLEETLIAIKEQE